MIHLTDDEKKIIAVTKGHYDYPQKGNWTLTLKPLFEEIYGWIPNDDLPSYRSVLFFKLLEIHNKITDDKSGTNIQIRDIFNAVFYRGIRRDFKMPIDRGINELCGLIQCNLVIDNGVSRYNLNV